MFCVPGQERRIADLWKHALATGSWGKEIARVRRRNVESTFLCGLLRDIGKPVLVQHIVEIATELDLRVDDETIDHLLDVHAPAVGSTIVITRRPRSIARKS